MSMDLKLELAKEEYVKSINEINKKYDLPLSFVELILQGILVEVSNIKTEKILKEKSDLEKKENSDIIKEREVM
jgi:hypothetical protein